MTATDRLAAETVRNADRITAPVVFLQAGQDAYADPDAQTRFFRRLRRGEILRLEGARHEILTETDDLRGRALAALRGIL